MELKQRRSASVMPPPHMLPFISSRQSPPWHQGSRLISGAEAYGFIYSGNAYKSVQEKKGMERRRRRRRKSCGGGRGGGRSRVAAVLSGGSGENLQSVSPGSVSPTTTRRQIGGGKVKDMTPEPSLPPLALNAGFQNGF